MLRMIEALAGLFSPWQSLYADSVAVSTIIMAIHLVALLLAGGYAVGADRATLLALREPVAARQSHVQQLHALHRPVLLGLAALLVSGLLMFAADIEVYATSAVFWVKMGLIALLLANGSRIYSVGAALLQRGQDDVLWRRLGSGARTSLGLWVAITIAGVVLSSTG